jgi:integrase
MLARVASTRDLVVVREWEQGCYGLFMFAHDNKNTPTVGDLFERYWPVICNRISPGTARGYASAWRQRVRPSFEDVPIDQLTTLDVERAFALWSGKRSTKVDALSVLSQVCQVAIKGRLIPTNPCAGVDLPRLQDGDPAARALDIAEVQCLLRVLPSAGPYRRFVLAMLYTGCRLGEVAGLRVSDVDWESRTISVSRTASAGASGELVIGPTKGRRARLVPLPDPFVPVVVEASAKKGPHDWLFPGPRGGNLNSQNLSRALDWKNIRDQVKTFAPGEPSLHWHDLRHTALTLMFRAGLSAPDVQAVAGHSTLQVTQRYADTRRDAARRATETLSSFFAPLGLSSIEGGEAGKSASDLDF